MSDLRSLEQLSQDATKAMQGAVRLITRRVNRDETLAFISDAYAALQMLAARIGGRDHGFAERTVKHVADDEDHDAGQQAMDRSAVEVSLLEVLDDEGVTATRAERDLLDELTSLDQAGALERLHQFNRHEQLKVLRAMINYMWHKAETPWEMMKRALAITRRYQRTKLRGISMTEVARLLDEKSRCAAVSARERDIHDELLIRWGIRAPKAADAGLRGESTCEKNRQRAMGNTNRRRAQEKLQFAAAHVGSKAKQKQKPKNTP